MKFTDSPVIELPVHSVVLSIQQDNGSLHVGTTVWPCSLVLVKFCERWSTPDPNSYSTLLDFKSKRAIEIGTGFGVAGMGLYLLGLNDIVLTDISPVMPTFKRNLKRDKPVLSKNLKHFVLYWKNQDQVQALNPTFDVVIATDIVYIEESVDPLISSMDAPLAENGVVLLRHQLRSPEAHKLFWEMSERIFEIQEVPHEDLHPEYAYDETYVYIFRKKKNKEEEDQEANP